MYIASFIYEPGNYDAEFDRLNAIIDSVARGLPGFLGAESWLAATGTRRQATYYWDSLDTLRQFAAHPAHQEAKRQYARWYDAYHVVISERVRSYGNGALDHPTASERLKTPAAVSPSPE